jgi:DNA-binding CsgD family transcriptional regulator
MKPKSHTEKEHLLTHKQNFYIAEQMLEQGSLTLQDLNFILPGYFHVVDSTTFLLKHISEKSLLRLDLSWEDIKILGTRFITEWHSHDTIAQILPAWQKFQQKGNAEEVGSAVQKIRVAGCQPNEFIPFFTFGKLTKSLDTFYKFSFDVRDLPFSDKIQSIIDENDFLRKNYVQFSRLTKQEKEILKRLAMGMRNQQIADELFISQNTVRTHRNNIHSKLEIRGTNVNHIALYIKYVEAFSL